MLKEFEKLIIIMECFALIGFIGTICGLGYGIYKVATWLIGV